MRAVTADEIRASFVNCSQGVAKRIALPALESQPWEQLDLLGWTDPSGSGASYLVAERPDGSPVGFVLQQAKGRPGLGRSSMCSLCRTVHSSGDVTLMTAVRPGQKGRQGNSRGNYLCADLDCSLYARGLKQPSRMQPGETLSVDAKVARLRGNLATLVRWLGAE